MLKGGARLSIALLLAGCTSICQAYWDPPTISPDAPTAGTPVSVVMTGGICDVLIDVPGYPQITRDGSAIRILVRTLHYTNSELCFYPVATVPVEVGIFAPGSYMLTVDIFYYDIFGFHQETLGVLPFHVSGTPPSGPAPAPALGFPGLFALATAIVAIVRYRRNVSWFPS